MAEKRDHDLKDRETRGCICTGRTVRGCVLLKGVWEAKRERKKEGRGGGGRGRASECGSALKLIFLHTGVGKAGT